jgi:hypothetical protein
MKDSARLPLGIAAASVAIALSIIRVAEAYQVRSLVVAGGATPSAGVTSGPIVHRATIAQPLVGRSASGAYGSTSGYWPGGGTVTVSVETLENDAQRLPAGIEFGPPHPNPSRGLVAFGLGLPREARVRMVVFDLQGRVVGESDEGVLPAGQYRLSWNGRGVAAGVCVARLEVDGQSVATRRLVLIR